MLIRSFAAFKAKQKLKPFSYEQKPLGLWDVRIKVTHCGICHSDVHLIDDDWGISAFPLVPGHEVVGEVTELGKSAVPFGQAPVGRSIRRYRAVGAAHLKSGMRVGVGWQAGSCMKCEWCRQDEEHLCNESRATCLGNYGGYGEEIVVDSRFAFPIPAKLSSEGAAPLLCGGATVFSPLRRFKVGKGTKVGILGIGGLGHLAVQYAAALGAEVTALSSSTDKERVVKEMGAKQFVLVTDKRQMEKVQYSLDFLLSTANADLKWETYLDLLKKRGTFCFVGVTPKKISFPAFSVIVPERRVVGSVIGSPKLIKEMLDFSAKHRIESKSEVVKLSEVNSAVSKVRKSQARYRVVLEI